MSSPKLELRETDFDPFGADQNYVFDGDQNYISPASEGAFKTNLLKQEGQAVRILGGLYRSSP